MARMMLPSTGMKSTSRIASYLAFAAVLAVAGSASARAHSREYSPVDKLSRGVGNMVAGVLEVPGQMIEESRDNGPAGLPVGFAKGLGMTVARELTGVYEFVTAPIPEPRGYAPVLEPEYPWDHFRHV